MTKQEIKTLLDQNHLSILSFLENHDNSKWNKGPKGKWTTGQHIIHLTQSIKPLNKALSTPKFILQYKFGKANRTPRSIDQIVEKYHEKLKNPNLTVSPFSRVLPETPPATKKVIIKKFTRQKEVLVKKLARISDKKLDKYIVPHPLMGRMLLREIIMWTAYHTEHHHKQLRENY